MTDHSIQTYICHIQDTLTEFASLPESRQKLADARADIDYHYRYWTSGVIRRIGYIGEEERFEVYSTFHYKERLYDLCWVEKDGGLTKSLPLALECEWDHSGNVNRYRREIEYDFEKLLWSCATFTGSPSDANYLFCVGCTYKDGNEFVFRRYSAEES